MHSNSAASHRADGLRRLCEYRVQRSQCVLYGSWRHDAVQRHAAVNPSLQVLQERSVAESDQRASQHQQCLGHYVVDVTPRPIPV